MKPAASEKVERNLAKTKVHMLMSQEDAKHEAVAWRFDDLHCSATVTFNATTDVTLGAETCGAQAAKEQFAEKVLTVKSMQRHILLCQDAQVELTLQRSCLVVSKVGHLLRASGKELSTDPATLQAYDDAQEA